ncbi:MAG: acylneuraminate cytidylyltransferase family protein [Emcibacter sp.]|nr:acylneuraminate cytidylyltransferase family protein [Emcibacter sp.]
MSKTEPSQNVVAFLPCRSGSQRVVKKNTRPFAGINNGLVEIKIHQLMESRFISQIVVSTDDQDIISICNQLKEKYNIKLETDLRPDHLASSSTSTDDLIKYVPEIIKNGIILWTHVTSPFIKADLYDQAIVQYKQNVLSGTYDSLLSVTPMQTFIWDKDGPVNYDRNKEKWPRTQTLPEWFEVNSGMFMIDVNLMLTLNDRVGRSPFLFPIEHQKAFDIDTQSHFDMAENMWKSIEVQDG